MSGEWTAQKYPVTVTCSFCGNTLTIALDDGGPSTVTTGHAHDCPQNPARDTSRDRQGSAA